MLIPKTIKFTKDQLREAKRQGIDLQALCRETLDERLNKKVCPKCKQIIKSKK